MNRPVSAVPAARKSQRALTLLVNTFLVAMLVAAVAGVLAVIAWASFTPHVPTKDELLPSASAAATTVAEDFLLARPTSVPTAGDVDPTFGRGTRISDQGDPLPVTSLSTLSVDNETLDGSATSPAPQRIEVHRFLVGLAPEIEDDSRETAPGDLFTLEVPMLLTDDGPVLGGSPALLPYERTDASSTRPVDYSQYTSGAAPEISPATRETISQWVTAFVTNDASALRSLARDGHHDADYQGLTGFELIEGEDVRFINAVPTVGDPNTKIVQIKVLVSSERANGYRTTLSYDLRVEGTDSQSPAVTAWGPPGSPNLQSYQNNPDFQS